MENSVFECLGDFGIEPSLWGIKSELMKAVRERDYPAIQTHLEQANLPFSVESGYHLCLAAIQSGCTCCTVEMLLDACPPAQEFCTAVAFFDDRYYEKLETEAAQFDRADVLEVLLERDASGLPLSAAVAEAALGNGSIACTKLLDRQPGIDWRTSTGLRQVWGRLGMDANVDLCLRYIVPRLTGLPIPVEGEIPLPDFLTVDMASAEQNWELARRICMEKGVSGEEGVRALRHLMGQNDVMHDIGAVQMLDCLLETCPALLRRDYPRYVLAVFLTTGGNRGRGLLRRHLDAMPGKRIPMFSDEFFDPCVDWCGRDGVLTNWDRALGEEYYPVLRRSEGLSGSFFNGESDRPEQERALEWLLSRCKVQGKVKPGVVSRLAREILRIASPALIARQMETGGVLAGEDGPAMLEWCSDRSLMSSRAAILAYMKKEVDYEL